LNKNKLVTLIDSLGLTSKERLSLRFQVRYNDKHIDIDKLTDCKRLNEDTQVDIENKSNKGSLINIINIEDCMAKFNRTEQLDSDNQWYCPKCQTQVNAFKSLSIHRMPQVLVLHLKRFKIEVQGGRSKNVSPVKFPINGLLDFSSLAQNHKN